VTQRSIDGNARMSAALQAHAHTVMQGGCVPEVTKELCAALVAGLNDCRPSLIEHRRNARKHGVDAVTLTEIWNHATSERYTPALRAALAAAVALTREPRALPASVRHELRAHYDDAQIVEILCVIGLENYRNRVMNALQPSQGAG
jgi:AhpD family alkylhydroperoxidase